MYILGSCDPNDCLGTVGPDNATFGNAIAGTTYYIVVDADDGSGSGYDIVVTCPTAGCVPILSLTTSVVSGVYEASIQVNSNTTVNNGTTVSFQGGNEVSLEAGFCVPAGADFEAIIDPCQ